MAKIVLDCQAIIVNVLVCMYVCYDTVYWYLHLSSASENVCACVGVWNEPLLDSYYQKDKTDI